MLNVTDHYCISPATSKGGFPVIRVICHESVIYVTGHVSHRSEAQGLLPRITRQDLDAGCLRFISLFRSSWVLPTEHHLFFEISTRLLPDGSPLTLGAVLMSTVMFVHMIVLLIAGIHTRCGRLC